MSFTSPFREPSRVFLRSPQSIPGRLLTPLHLHKVPPGEAVEFVSCVPRDLQKSLRSLLPSARGQNKPLSAQCQRSTWGVGTASKQAPDCPLPPWEVPVGPQIPQPNVS